MHSFRATAGAMLWVCAVMVLSPRVSGQNLLNSDPNSPGFNNPSFERPDTDFVSIVADKWTTSGPRRLVNIPGIGDVPLIAGCGIFENPPTVLAGRIDGADGAQLGYIFANSVPDVITGQVLDHAFTQILSLPVQAGLKYTLTMGVANAQAAPPPDSVLTMSLFAFDPGNSSEQLLASKTITNNGDTNGLTLVDFSANTTVIPGGAVGKQIGIRIGTHTDPKLPSATGEFDFDNLRLTAVPEPGSALMLAGGVFLTFRARRRR